MAEVTNASKTSNPFKTDIQLLSLLKKRAAASREAAAEFSNAKRDDLSNKELAQVAVLDEYAAEVQVLGKEEMASAIQKVISQKQTDGETVNVGSVLKALFAPGGGLDGEAADRAEVARLAKAMV